MNITVLWGTLSSDPIARDLPSGDSLISYEVTTPAPDGGRADTVPVVWFDPPSRLPALGAGDEVVVSGRVRRRFFRPSGGPTVSRPEVVADSVLPGRSRARVGRLLERRIAELADASSPAE